MSFRLALAAAVAVRRAVPAGSVPPPLEEPEGLAPSIRDSTRPSVTAHFPHDSYRPGDLARLVISSRATAVRLQVFRVGPEHRVHAARDEHERRPGERGAAARRASARADRPGPSSAPGRAASTSRASTAAGGHTGFAPFVLRPTRLGEHRVAVVMPTQTWQAYNHRDDDHDGVDDTWYVAGDTARLGRAHLNRGVPFRFRNYDAPFIRWTVADAPRRRLPHRRRAQPDERRAARSARTR